MSLVHPVAVLKQMVNKPLLGVRVPNHLVGTYFNNTIMTSSLCILLPVVHLEGNQLIFLSYYYIAYIHRGLVCVAACLPTWSHIGNHKIKHLMTINLYLLYISRQLHHLLCINELLPPSNTKEKLIFLLVFEKTLQV